jgi:hypothetical protein
MKPSNAFNRLKLAGSCCSWWVALYQEHITTKKLYQRQLEEVLKISNIVFIQRKNVLMEKKHHARFLQTFHSFWNLWAFPGRVSGCHFHRDRGVVHGYGEKIRKHGNVTCQKLVNW